MKRKGVFISLIVFLLVMSAVSVLAGAPFIWTPRLGNVTVNSVEITYRTEGQADTYVQYALKSDYEAGKGWSAKTAVQHGEHFRLQMTGLISNSQYVYQVVVNGEPATEVYSFFTAPEEEIEFTFLACGDTQTFPEKYKLMADLMVVDETHPRFVIQTGDLVTNGGQADLWLGYNLAIEKLGAFMPYYSAIGNHEYNSENYYNNLALPRTGGGQNKSEWYSFDYAGVHFIILDTNILDKYLNHNVPNAVELQREWLLKDLEAHKEAKWIIALFHHPIYSSHESSRYPQLQEEFVPLFDQYGVDLVINGHHHIYERVFLDGRNYITTGGGGGPFDYSYQYEPRTEGSVILEDAVLQYVRVRVTADKLYADVIQTHEEADDFFSLNANYKILDSVEIENIHPQH